MELSSHPKSSITVPKPLHTMATFTKAALAASLLSACSTSLPMVVNNSVTTIKTTTNGESTRYHQHNGTTSIEKNGSIIYTTTDETDSNTSVRITTNNGRTTITKNGEPIYDESSQSPALAEKAKSAAVIHKKYLEDATKNGFKPFGDGVRDADSYLKLDHLEKQDQYTFRLRISDYEGQSGIFFGSLITVENSSGKIVRSTAPSVMSSTQHNTLTFKQSYFDKLPSGYSIVLLASGQDSVGDTFESYKILATKGKQKIVVEDPRSEVTLEAEGIRAAVVAKSDIEHPIQISE